ncbi:hypothetical protein BGZ70_000297 [Mortierella alpina]|uniref:Uncharacterized protein n=1 Tax=Mortierella alpina TaxID=64518 RepID=A0A9P6IYI1_MORAP|nr:hypothetical protein BGZ70_000297 [Mortierella alpina]
MHTSNNFRKQQAMRALDALLSSSTSRPPAGPSYGEQPSPPNRHDTQADPPGLDQQESDTDPSNLDSHDEDEGFATNAAPLQQDSQRQWLLQRQEMERQLQRQQQKQQQQLPNLPQQHAGRTTDEAEDADEEDEDEENDEDGHEERGKQSDTQGPSPRKHHGSIAPSNPQQGAEKDPAATISNSNRPRKYNKNKASDRGASSVIATTPSNAPKRQYKKTILRQQAALLDAQLKEENKARDSEATRRVLARTGVIKHLRSLKSRLSFAQYKVDKGWEDQPLPLVTELFEESLEDSGDSNDELAPFMPYRRRPTVANTTAEEIAPSHYARAILTAAPVELSAQKSSRYQGSTKSAWRKEYGSEQAQGVFLGHGRRLDRDVMPGLVDSDNSEADENDWDTPCTHEGTPTPVGRPSRSSETSGSLSPSRSRLLCRQHPEKRVDAFPAIRSTPSARETMIKHQQQPAYQRPLSSNGSETCSENESLSDSGTQASGKTMNASKVQPTITKTVASSKTVPSTQDELQRQQQRQLEELQKRQLEQLQELQKLQQKQQMELQKAHAQMARHEPAPSKSDDLRLKPRSVSRPKDARQGSSDKENVGQQSNAASLTGRRQELLQAQKQPRSDGRYDRSLAASMAHERPVKPFGVNSLPSRSNQISAPIVRKQQQQRPVTPLMVRQPQEQQQHGRGSREQSLDGQRERLTNMRQEEYRQYQRKKLQQNEEKEQELLRLQRRLEQQHSEQQRRKTLLLQLQKPTQQLQVQAQGRREVLRPEHPSQVATPKKKKPLNPVQKAPSTENILASVRSTHSNIRSTLVAASPSMATAKNILLGSKRVLQSGEDKENFASPTSSPIRRTQYSALDSSEWATRQPTSSKGVKRQKPAVSLPDLAVSRSLLSMPEALRATNTAVSVAGMGLHAEPSPFMVPPGMAHASSSPFTAALLNASPEVHPAVVTVPEGVQSNKEFLNCFDQWMSDLGTEDLAGLSSVPSSESKYAEEHLAGSNAQESRSGATSSCRNEGAGEKSEREEAEEEDEEEEFEGDDEDDATQTGQSGPDDETELDDAELDRLLYSEVGEDYFYAGQASTPGSDFGSTQDLNSDGATPDLYDWFPDAVHEDGTASMLTTDQHLSLLSTDPILSSSPGELSQGLELGLEFDTAGDPLWLQQELQLQRQQLEHHQLHQQQQQQQQQQLELHEQSQHEQQIQPLLCSSRGGTPQLDSTTSTLLSSSSLADMLPGSTLLGGSPHYVPLGLGGEPMSDHSIVGEDPLGKNELLLSAHPSSVDYYF